MIDTAVASRLGMTPLGKEELDTLASATLPVAQKYAEWFLIQPEAILLATIAMIYGPRAMIVYAEYRASKEKEAKKVEAAKIEGNPETSEEFAGADVGP